MKTIGFIDYFLDEWHANNYPQMIDEYNKKHGENYKIAYAWEEISNPNGGIPGEKWCENFDAKLCGSIEELCNLADYIMILAPSNPEKHLEYAERVFACGKSPYIDKTFAPNVEDAKKIFESSEKNGVKFFSSSALRYAEEIAEYDGNAVSVLTTGGGRLFDEYIIHQIEQAVKCLGVGAGSVKYENNGETEIIEVRYVNGKCAEMHFAPSLPFVSTVENAERVSVRHEINSPYFDNLIADICKFFESGELPFDFEQTLEIMKIRQAAIECKNKKIFGEWVKI